MNTAVRKSFIPETTPNAIATIDRSSDATYFVMMQRQPADMYDPEALDLQPHCIYAKGSYETAERRYNNLLNRARLLHASETAELFSRGEGVDYVNFVMLRGAWAITVTLCTRDKARALAL